MQNVKGVCPLPFTQLFLNPNGTVAPCCYLAQAPYYHVGDIQKQTLEEMWNSPKMRTLRKELLEGKPKICQFQMQASQCNRIRQDLAPRAVYQEVVPFPMQRLDLMLNGHCNLECVMCDVWTMPNGVYGENGFWEQGKESIFPYLVELDVKGGEPFIQKDVYRLIEEVSAVNPECNWHFTTNGHYRFNARMRDAVSKIRIVRLSLSIDSLDPARFAQIRKKGDLSLVLRTLDDWIEYKRITDDRLLQINSNFVVQKDNWREVPAFYSFCRQKGIAPFFIILTHPSDLSILNLPLEERLEALERYYEAMRVDQDPVYFRIIRPLQDSIPAPEAIGLVGRHQADVEQMKTFGPSIADVQA